MAVKEFEYEYNPIKELKGGVEASKVVWSTKSLELAVDGITKGMPLKANPFCGTNTKLLKPDLVYKRTKEEVEDYMKCMQDPVYFASKCYLMTAEGLAHVKMRDYQVEYLNQLKNNRFSILLAARQSGKSTTTGIFCLWKILFHPDTNGLVLSKSGAAGQDLIKKIKDMYLYLPYYLKAGTMKWNQSSFSFDNNSSISTEAFSSTAGLGQTINMLILDEFAWCPPGDVDLFYENVIPTVTTMPNSTVAIMSTQNGFNLFYKLWKNAIEKKSVYVPYKIDWQQVPQYNIETKQWEKRTEEWHKMMVGILGSEESFQYQYGTQFSASDKCIISREKLSKIRDKAILFENSSKFELLEGLKLMTNGTLFIKPDYDVMKFKTGYFLILQDLAEGGGADYTVFNIFEISFLDGKPIFEQVAFWRSNEVKLEIAALDFWLLVAQLFTQENILVSIEWNTYGALYLKELINYNETGLSTDNYKWRFNIGTEFEYTNLVQYKKGSIEDAITIKGGYKNSKTIPGIRWNAESKKTACSMTKIMLENDEIIITDLINIGELENFEDKNGTGSYKASYGHDDMMMTIIQIPMVLQTAKWINFKEEVQEKLMLNDNQVMHTNNIYDMHV